MEPPSRWKLGGAWASPFTWATPRPTEGDADGTAMGVHLLHAELRHAELCGKHGLHHDVTRTKVGSTYRHRAHRATWRCRRLSRSLYCLAATLDAAGLVTLAAEAVEPDVRRPRAAVGARLVRLREQRARGAGLEVGGAGEGGEKGSSAHRGHSWRSDTSRLLPELASYLEEVTTRGFLGEAQRIFSEPPRQPEQQVFIPDTYRLSRKKIVSSPKKRRVVTSPR